MSIKLALLKSGETVISDIKELVSEENQFRAYLFNKPHKIETRKTLLLMEESESNKGDIEVSLSPWIILTTDDQITVSPDWIVAIVEPIQTIKEMYEEKLNGQSDQMSFS
jgi:hypothetical protein